MDNNRKGTRHTLHPTKSDLNFYKQKTSFSVLKRDPHCAIENNKIKCILCNTFHPTVQSYTLHSKKHTKLKSLDFYNVFKNKNGFTIVLNNVEFAPEYKFVEEAGILKLGIFCEGAKIGFWHRGRVDVKGFREYFDAKRKIYYVQFNLLQ